MSAHTAGPWRVLFPGIYEVETSLPYWQSPQSGSCRATEIDANARLMALSPEMLDFVQVMSEMARWPVPRADQETLGRCRMSRTQGKGTARQGQRRGMSAEAVANLIDIYAEAHAVLCRQKVAIEKGWQKLRPTAGDVWNHLNANPHNCVGVVPSSLGFTVMDVDIGSPMTIALAANPAVVIPSQGEGRAHLWYPDSEGRENRKWFLNRLQGRGFVASGEIRSGSGYVILWPGAAEALLYYIDFQGALTWTLAQAVLWPDVSEQPTMDLRNKLPPEAPRQAPSQPGRRPIADTAGQADRATLYRQVLSEVSAEAYDDWIGVGLALEGSVRQGSIPESVARQLWDEFSATSSKFNSQVQERRWRSFQGATDNPRTMGTYVTKRNF